MNISYKYIHSERGSKEADRSTLQKGKKYVWIYHINISIQREVQRRQTEALYKKEKSMYEYII